jgi:glycosyltransferase involved in cell wall biosynthesis
MSISCMRILIVASNASSRMGGEAFIPLNYFRFLLARKMDVWLVVHSRNRAELTALFPDNLDRLRFVEDTSLHKKLNRFGQLLPRRLADATTGFIIHLTTQLAQRRLIRELVKTHAIDVVHEPIPVSPKTPSLMWGLGAAAIIGPLNGGMEYPKAFRRERNFISGLALGLGRALANLVNLLLPGKRRADIVLVANRRTREALPTGVAGQVIDLVENGVDFSIWKRSSTAKTASDSVRFIFVGRLIDWKAIDIVLAAMHRLEGRLRVSLEIIGDGPMRQTWQDLAHQLGLGANVQFTQWLSQHECALRLQQADVFVLPSLFECGGAVVLEAMAMGLPVIATAWGGPADYLDQSCGILVKPDSRESLIAGFASAMTTLVQSPALRERLGRAGLSRARAEFDWERKIDRITDLYELAIKSRTDHPARHGH